jgi:long-chain acyl-CoA synthetase
LFNFETFLARFRNPRPTLRTINFLLFDHIGGINTLFHTLFNQGVVVIPKERTPEKILEEIRKNGVELLPTTPTFLRMMLISGLLEKNTSGSLKVVTYGTERMDQGTLDKLCDLMPAVDFRQTYGMSELGILRAKSRERDSLWMKIGGEGIETRIDEGVLLIRSSNRMIGYLNADSPFDEQGWYDTKDLVDQDDEWVRIVGRTVDVISVGGIKVLPEEIERAALLHPDVAQAKAVGVENPITGQHIELVCEACNEADLTRKGMRSFLKNHLSSLVMPHRIRIGDVAISHRFKKH